MYRCEVCYDVSQPGQPQLRHVIQRHRPKTQWNSGAGTEIAREVSVCHQCQSMLSGKASYQQVYRAHRKERESRMDEERREKQQRLLFRKEAEREPVPKLRTTVSYSGTIPAELMDGADIETVVLDHPLTFAPARMLGRVVTAETNHHVQIESIHAQEQTNHAASHEVKTRKPQARKQGRKKCGT